MRDRERPAIGHAGAAFRARFHAGSACLVALVLASCALIDLSGFPVSTYPSGADGVLESAEAVWVQFPEPVDHAVVEPLLTVTAAGQVLPGDLAWDSNRLIYTPVKPFEIGVRHILRLQGSVTTIAGRTFNETVLVPFYVGTDAPAPIISSVAPAEGAVVDILAPLTLGFSAPMDTALFGDSFSVSPATDFRVSWNAGRTAATISPVVRWEAEELYTWTVALGCKSETGIAVAHAWSGTFLVQADATYPAVLPPGRAVVSGALITPLPGGLSELLRGDSMVLRFSEDVDLATLETAFSLSPAVAGTLRRVSPGTFVFVPAEDWTMGQEYVLAISTDLEDLAGNPLRSPFRQVFTPAIPAQAVTEIDLAGTLSDAPVYHGAQLNNSIPWMLNWVAGAPPDDALVLTATLHFSQPYDVASPPIVVSAVRFAGWYPDSVISPQVTQVSWIGPQTVSISYIGFARSANTPSLHRLYYRLTIAPGVEMTGNQDGSYLKDQVTLLLESGSDS
jgi:hypothetical protein